MSGGIPPKSPDTPPDTRPPAPRSTARAADAWPPAPSRSAPHPDDFPTITLRPRRWAALPPLLVNVALGVAAYAALLHVLVARGLLPHASFVVTWCGVIGGPIRAFLSVLAYNALPDAFRLDACSLTVHTPLRPSARFALDAPPDGASIELRPARLRKRTWIVTQRGVAGSRRTRSCSIDADLFDISHERWTTEVLPRLHEWAARSAR